MEPLLHPTYIFTIGYGNRTFDDFVELIKRHDIYYLVDVRTSAYSKFNPLFSQEFLQRRLGEHKIRYVFMGDVLGGKPTDNRCYTDGKVDYAKVEEQEFYQKGVDRLRTAFEKRIKLVLMCSELKPQSCHRSKLIGQTLAHFRINVIHIDETGELRSQPEIIRRISNGQQSLFEQKFTSRKTYM